MFWCRKWLWKRTDCNGCDRTYDRRRELVTAADLYGVWLFVPGARRYSVRCRGREPSEICVSAGASRCTCELFANAEHSYNQIRYIQYNHTIKYTATTI